MKKNIFYLVGLVVVLGVGILLGFTLSFVLKGKEEKNKIPNITIKKYANQDYYIITGDYSGDFDYQKVDLSDHFNKPDAKETIKLYNTTEVLNYEEYKAFCEKWNLKQKYQDTNKNYMIISYAAYGQPIVEARLANVEEKNGKVTIYLWENIRGVTADISGYFIAIPVELDTYQYDLQLTYTEEEFENIKKYNSKQNPNNITEDKPILYIYPEKETDVEVRLGHPENLTVSYPIYQDSWKVTATPDGTLKDRKTNKQYYGLYYEGKNHEREMKQVGFVVKKEDTISFLEEKLTILGLTERERNEFIIYWLPRLQESPYNYIYFETPEEINSYMPIEINPTPDSFIRIVMDYKPLETKIKVEEEPLTPISRTGYSVVEWGGSKITN